MGDYQRVTVNDSVSGSHCGYSVGEVHTALKVDSFGFAKAFSVIGADTLPYFLIVFAVQKNKQLAVNKHYGIIQRIAAAFYHKNGVPRRAAIAASRDLYIYFSPIACRFAALAVAKQSSLARCHDAGYSEIGIITVSLFNYNTIVSFRLIFLIIYIKKTISYTNIAIFFTPIAFFAKVWYTVKKRGKKMSSLIYRQSGRDDYYKIWHTQEQNMFILIQAGIACTNAIFEG
jgi:hypothetical protein